VVAVASHDTASAVVATPLRTEISAFISCGTWGLVGVEAERPILSQAAREANFTNELGLDRRIRFLRNIMGLWLLNESVDHWNSTGGSHTIADLVARAADYTGALGVFDVNDPVFMAPGDMPNRIETWLAEHDQPIPEGPVGMVASIIESLARAFAAKPRILLIDEMSLGLAPVVFLRLMPIVKSIADSGVGVLLVEQFTQLALDLAQEAVVVAGGRVSFQGASDALRADPGLLHRAYLGG
jgi:hypothetical protein